MSTNIFAKDRKQKLSPSIKTHTLNAHGNHTSRTRGCTTRTGRHEETLVNSANASEYMTFVFRGVR